MSTSERMTGYDVARAIAVLGMVMVDLRHVLDSHHGSAALVWFFDAIEGKAAALFVLLAGVGVSLRTRAREDVRPLVERAAILISVGLLLMHLWEYEILHFHGIYLLLAIPLLRVRTVTLWILALATVWIAMVLGAELDWTLRPTLTFAGAVRHVFFNGLYPVFPWIAFVLVGMAVGRLDLHHPRVRRLTLVVAFAVAMIAFGLDALGRWEMRTDTLGLGGSATWLLTWPRAPRPLFVVSGSAVGVALTCTCIELAQRNAGRGWVTVLVATGQLTFTIYVAHVIAILVPIHHGILGTARIEVALLGSLAFWIAAMAFALWWRRRWRHGPLEGLLRQVSAREAPTNVLR